MNKFNLVLSAVVVGTMSVSSWASADTGAADELMAALKECKADSAATKSAQSMIKKHGGKPTDDQVDDWVDEQDDKLFKCLDKKL
ncbi:MAG: hypothetical protein ISQ66_02715 [Luminiphilus sp.]|nr:hypothetical protein [Luminiphilus sp.]